jgi:hypothetical protein
MPTPLVTRPRQKPIAIGAPERDDAPDVDREILVAVRRLVEQHRVGNELLAAVLDVQREILAVVREKCPAGTRAEDDARHVQLLEVLADTMAPYDVAFEAVEVLNHRATDHALDEALAACRITDTLALGTLFRDLRDRDLGGLRLVREGRSWRLART